MKDHPYRKIYNFGKNKVYEKWPWTLIKAKDCMKQITPYGLESDIHSLILGCLRWPLIIILQLSETLHACASLQSVKLSHNYCNYWIIRTFNFWESKFHITSVATVGKDCKCILKKLVLTIADQNNYKENYWTALHCSYLIPQSFRWNVWKKLHW